MMSTRRFGRFWRWQSASCCARVVGADGATAKVRIIQTNSAGDNVHVIDPVDEQGRRA